MTGYRITKIDEIMGTKFYSVEIDKDNHEALVAANKTMTYDGSDHTFFASDETFAEFLKVLKA